MVRVAVSSNGGSRTPGLGVLSGQGHLTVEFRFWPSSFGLAEWSSPRKRESPRESFQHRGAAA